MKSKSLIRTEVDALLARPEADRLDDLLRGGQQVLISDMIMFFSAKSALDDSRRRDYKLDQAIHMTTDQAGHYRDF